MGRDAKGVRNEAVLVKAWPLSQFWLSWVLIAPGGTSQFLGVESLI